MGTETALPNTTPLYDRIARSLAERIRTLAYAPGARIPGTRQLAREFQVSINTVLQAQTVLENSGLIEAVPRSGYYVRWQPPSPSVGAVDEFRPTPALVPNQRLALDLLQLTQHGDFAQLGAALPAARYLPGEQLRRAASRAARLYSADCLRYMPAGLTSLRQRLAQRMATLDCQVQADELVVTQGCHEALLLALRALTQPGDIVALESPVYYGLLQIVDSLNLKALEIPCDPVQGMDLQALRKACDRWPVKACIVVGSYSNPLGSCPDAAARQALLALLQHYRIPLVEDDLYGDLAFDGLRPRPYKHYDSHGQVLYCNSFSKTVAPGLRLGWIAPGPVYVDQVRYLKYTQNLASPMLDQHVLDLYLQDGNLDRHIRKLRGIYGANLLRTAELIERRFPAGTTVTRPGGGFVCWVRLPPPLRAQTLYEQARQHRISIAPGGIFSTTNRYDDCFRINCALPWEILEPALRTLARLG